MSNNKGKCHSKNVALTVYRGSQIKIIYRSGSKRGTFLNNACLHVLLQQYKSFSSLYTTFEDLNSMQGLKITHGSVVHHPNISIKRDPKLKSVHIEANAGTRWVQTLVHAECKHWYTLSANAGTRWVQMLVHAECKCWYTLSANAGTCWVQTLVHAQCKCSYTMSANTGTTRVQTLVHAANAGTHWVNNDIMSAEETPM